MQIIVRFNQENVTDDEAKQFRCRRAVRGVLFDSENKIALIHALNEGYYSLPGGGVEDGETYEQGVVRECREEAGCDAEVVKYIGTTIEYRKNIELLNESWGYTLKVIGDKSLPIMTGDESEAEKNSVVIWVSVVEAIRLIEPILPNPRPQSGFALYNSNFLERDLIFLKSVEKLNL